MMTALRNIWAALTNARRCPGCKKYPLEKHSVQNGKPAWVYLGYCDELGLYICMCPACGLLVRDDIYSVLTSEHVDRFNEWLIKKEEGNTE